ncbi:MAG: alpha/beta hydrolase [Paracoccaceae bacterium]
MLNFHRFGRGPTFVMQHGFLGGGGYFAPQMAAMGDRFDIIAPDLPGFAGSMAEPPASSIKAMSEAQVGLLDALGVGKFHLLGHSMGGMVALQTALDHPDRVERLVLYATNSSGNLPGRFETFEETCARVERDGVEPVAARITATWFRDREAAPMYPFCVAAGAGATKAAVVAALRAFSGWDVAGRLAELTMPVLVIFGDRDRSYNLDGLIAMTRAIDGAEMCVLPGAAHCAHLEVSDLFNSALAKFLSAR